MLLTNNKYSHKVISNSHNPFNYDVHIGGGSVRDFIALNLAWLQMGEKVLCVTTSQVYGEIISEMARRKIPMTEGCIERLDSKTIDKKKDLLRDPVYYFVDKKTRLVTLSPVVESGCNIDDKGLEKPLFDRVMAYFPNLDTRLHMQLLNRYRGNAPRYIFGVNRSADATDGGMTPEAILKKWNANATETTVALGRGKLKQTAEGNAWDRISAEFKARKNISHAYSLSLLKSELAARGHKCVDVDWQALAVETYSANGLDMYDGKDIAQAYKDIKAAIERASADEIAIANPGMMTVEQAIRISKSAETSYEQKVVAKKCLLNHDYPGTNLDDPDFVLNAIVKDRGRIAKAAKMRMVMSDRKLATALDKEIYGKLEQLPHINKKHVPVNTLTHDLFAPIKQELDLLVSGCQYRRDDAEVKRVSEYLIKRKNEIYRLLGLSMCEEVPGAAHTTPIANVNKVLKKLGYDVKCKHQLAEGKNRPRTYAVTNFDCTYTKQIMDSLKLKYKELMTATNEVSNKDIYTETSFVDSDELASYQAYSDNARLLLLVCDHPEEYGLYRSVLTDEDLTAASKELPNYRRQELKKIVVEYNKKAA
jgi:hypothetical protein